MYRMNTKLLYQDTIETPLGVMIAIADEEMLYLLEFVERVKLEEGIGRLRKKTRATIIPGSTKITASIEKELSLYFAGKLKEFKTPLCLLGSPFQKEVWEELKKIPFGTTHSYSGLAIEIQNPLGCRAVARANSTNRLAIVIPCHRVINKGGELGGYAGGIQRKKWLLEHESSK